MKSFISGCPNKPAKPKAKMSKEPCMFTTDSNNKPKSKMLLFHSETHLCINNVYHSLTMAQYQKACRAVWHGTKKKRPSPE